MVSVGIIKRAEDFTNEDLLAIYTLFCNAYNLKIDFISEKYFTSTRVIHSAKEHLITRSIDHRPLMGAKFFGERAGEGVKFGGYNEHADNPDLRLEDFLEGVKKYFKKQHIKVMLINS